MKAKEKFTPGPWILGIPFSHKGSSSEWCNIYAADGDKNHIAEVLLFDGVNKNYYNANLISAAPDMYQMLYVCCEKEHSFKRCEYRPERCEDCPIKQLLKKARGEE